MSQDTFSKDPINVKKGFIPFLFKKPFTILLFGLPFKNGSVHFLLGLSISPSLMVKRLDIDLHLLFLHLTFFGVIDLL